MGICKKKEGRLRKRMNFVGKVFVIERERKEGRITETKREKESKRKRKAERERERKNVDRHTEIKRQ